MTGVARLIWIEPALAAPSGGQHYNRRVIQALRRAGVAVHVISSPGNWPHPSTQQREAVLEKLKLLQQPVTSAPPSAGADPAAAVIVDGLVGGCMPELFEPSVSDTRSRADVLLIHLPLAAEGKPESESLGRIEARAMAAARRVVATSDWAAEDLRRRHRTRSIDVIPPGVDLEAGHLNPGPQTEPAEPPGPPFRLTMAAAFTPRKNHRLLGPVLSGLLHHRWTLQLAGPGGDHGHGAAVLAELRDRLPERVHHLGSLTADQMPWLWSRTDLLLLPSWAETYGMVITEACLHGVPAVVSSGTGAVEAMAEAGASADPHDPQEWMRVLEDWMESPALRGRWSAASRRRAGRLPSWTQTGTRWMRLLASPPTG